ncbi:MULTISPECIES: DUF7503 family protein [Saliphagus]|uniref:Uncharacterized protein n=1 Tax=Saliphagus infecundisoli TaxID=1849069 RepID=A0ABD5QLS9_9EURY|nr:MULTISPECIES: hypothetical protein [Saliphagus]
MSDSNSDLLEYLADHPRAIGVLATVCLLLSQAAPVAAGNNGTIT